MINWRYDDVFLFFPENRIWHFMKISPLETLCMKYQNLMSCKNQKNIWICRLLKKITKIAKR